MRSRSSGVCSRRVLRVPAGRSVWPPAAVWLARKRPAVLPAPDQGVAQQRTAPLQVGLPSLVPRSGLPGGGRGMGVTIGVDPHKASCTAAVLDQRGELVAQQRFAATRTGSRALRRWAKRWPERCWAVEGASGLGRTLAQQLVGDGELVLDVPAKLAARVRLLSTGHSR